jgi:plastocyanin
VTRATVVVAAVCLLAGVRPALATTHQATVANYYFEDDQQHDRTKLVVQQGDQITFTVRQASYPPHTIDVDALDIHSPDLLVGQTYTTPVLKKTGNFYLYCRPHEARGHHTRLIVTSTPGTTARPAPSLAPTTTAPPRASITAGTPAPGATPLISPTPVASASPVPAGVGTAPPGSLDRVLTPDPGSLEALTGHRTSNRAPWTRAVWWLLIAVIPIAGAAAFALRRASQLDAAADRAAADAQAAAAATSAARKRKPRPKRKP